MRASRMLVLSSVVLLLGACSGDSGTNDTDTISLTSNAFPDGGDIPEQYTCDGQDVSPSLAWEGAPEGTAAYALIVEDPDANGFVHWVVADIPADARSAETRTSPGIDGQNDAGTTGYSGPCPPSGEHRYVFTIYALGDALGLAPGFSADELRSAMEGRVLATGQLTGRYRSGR